MLGVTTDEPLKLKHAEAINHGLAPNGLEWKWEWEVEVVMFGPAVNVEAFGSSMGCPQRAVGPEPSWVPFAIEKTGMFHVFFFRLISP